MEESINMEGVKPTLVDQVSECMKWLERMPTAYF